MKKEIKLGNEILATVCSEDHEDIRKLVCIHYHQKELLLLSIVTKDSKEEVITLCVNYCPICGFSYQPERSKRENTEM